MNIGEAVKERILELCREHDISVNKLSSMSGVTQSTVNNIVSGRNNSATVSTIKKFCDGLALPLRSSSIPNCSVVWNRKSNKQRRQREQGAHVGGVFILVEGLILRHSSQTSASTLPLRFHKISA